MQEFPRAGNACNGGKICCVAFNILPATRLCQLDTFRAVFDIFDLVRGSGIFSGCANFALIQNPHRLFWLRWGSVFENVNNVNGRKAKSGSLPPSLLRQLPKLSGYYLVRRVTLSSRRLGEFLHCRSTA